LGGSGNTAPPPVPASYESLNRQYVRSYAFSVYEGGRVRGGGGWEMLSYSTASSQAPAELGLTAHAFLHVHLYTVCDCVRTVN